jgi:hypothetical protein
MEITPQELVLLNFYRVSELHGGLVLATCVGRARDSDLILALTRHSAEELVHSQLWAETIRAVGGKPFPSRDTYQRRYAAALRPPTSLLEVLVLTQVFERRVYRHFTEHLRRPGTHPVVRVTLTRMIEEEKGHLKWVKRWLDDQRAERADLVRSTMLRCTEVDRRIYDSLVVQFGWRRAA